MKLYYIYKFSDKYSTLSISIDAGIFFEIKFRGKENTRRFYLITKSPILDNILSKKSAVHRPLTLKFLGKYFIPEVPSQERLEAIYDFFDIYYNRNFLKFFKIPEEDSLYLISKIYKDDMLFI